MNLLSLLEIDDPLALKLASEMLLSTPLGKSAELPPDLSPFWEPKPPELTGKEWSKIQPYNVKAQILAEQNNCCAICGTEIGKILRAQLDHDHNTGVVRGVLCRSCNSTLGTLESFIKSRLLIKAFQYLKKGVK